MHLSSQSRRNFVKASTAIAASSVLTGSLTAKANQNSGTLKIGLVGIGGRGSGEAMSRLLHPHQNQ